MMQTMKGILMKLHHPLTRFYKEKGAQQTPGGTDIALLVAGLHFLTYH
jgi:hypothetical protein